MDDIAIRRILVPIDGSEHAHKALRYALYLATKCQAVIHILTAYTLSDETYALIQRALPRGLAADYQNEVKETNELILRRAVDWARERYPLVTISSSLVLGRPAEQIVETAQSGVFDLIVMGSRGLGGIRGWLLGSVADRVSDNARCPVMIVK